jgi:tRNA modification GTPase
MIIFEAQTTQQMESVMGMINEFDTIAAIATAVSNAGIGIIRISGSEAMTILSNIFEPYNKKVDVHQLENHRIYYGNIKDGQEVIDECIVLIMKGPHSYTKEDVVEIDCHGGVTVVYKVLNLVLKNGARAAEPGEFTKRAFLNGRIDLSQAESVIDVINSKNDFALKSSLSQLGGAVLGSIRQIREQLLHEIAFIESALDDPEHISLDGYPQKLRAIVDNKYVEIDGLLKTSDNGRILKEGINTVIIGKPNAGKSSLLNVLVGSDRAIVTDIAGTTRDVLEEQINIGGITLNLVDTAGIRSTEDVVEKIGVKKAMEHANEADLIIYVVDSSVALDDNDYDIINFIKDKKAVILLNKSDLASKVSADDIKKLVDKTVISVSAKESSGIDELSDTIKEMFFDGEVSFNDEIYITNIRHKKLLSDAKESLKLVMNSIDDDMPEDFYSIDLMSAYESLGLIIGESVEDDLMDEIFSKFCMGK